MNKRELLKAGAAIGAAKAIEPLARLVRADDAPRFFRIESATPVTEQMRLDAGEMVVLAGREVTAFGNTYRVSRPDSALVVVARAKLDDRLTNVPFEFTASRVDGRVTRTDGQNFADQISDVLEVGRQEGLRLFQEADRLHKPLTRIRFVGVIGHQDQLGLVHWDELLEQSFKMEGKTWWIDEQGNFFLEKEEPAAPVEAPAARPAEAPAPAAQPAAPARTAEVAPACPAFPRAGQVYRSNRGDGSEIDKYRAVWTLDGRLWQPNLPPGTDRQTHAVAITLPVRDAQGRQIEYVFNGVSARLFVDAQRNGRGSANPMFADHENGKLFTVSTADGGEAWALVESDAGVSAGFEIKQVNRPC